LRYFIELSYHGKMYHGWQVQPRENSVQATIESALSVLLKDKISVVGCGRTDAGVHAEQFFLHFDHEKAVDEKKFKFRLNSFLPADIAVFRIYRVKPDAHARFHAVSRSYEYRISLEKNVFLSDTALQLMQADPDIERMNTAAQLLLDYKDFKCFSRSKTDVKTYLCDVSEAFWEREGKVLIFRISANRFLRNMVRAVVGTLLEVGKHKMSIAEFEEVIKNRDRTRAGASVKAKGLFLTRVNYPEDIFKVS
jgi:tRNA pseudouridine38-40 synthase